MLAFREGSDCRRLHFTRKVKGAKFWFMVFFNHNSQQCFDNIWEAGMYTSIIFVSNGGYKIKL